MTDESSERFHRRLLKSLWSREPNTRDDRRYSSEVQFRRALVDELPRLRAHALVLTNNPGEADDLVQETCEKSLIRWRQFSGSGSLAGWLYRIMQNTWRDGLRSAAVRTTEPLPDELSANVPTPDKLVALEQTRRAIATLPPEQRAALLLVAVEGFTYPEAAAALEVPVGTIRSRISRARSALVDILEPDPGGES